MCLRITQFSQLSFMEYVGMCGYSLPISLTMIGRIRVLYLISIIKSEIWPVCHCLGLGHEITVWAVSPYKFQQIILISKHWCYDFVLSHYQSMYAFVIPVGYFTSRHTVIDMLFTAGCLSKVQRGPLYFLIAKFLLKKYWGYRTIMNGHRYVHFPTIMCIFWNWQFCLS